MTTVKELLENSCPMSLANCPNDEGAFDGSCPCGEIHGENFEVVFHCWRSNRDCECKHSGIHVSGTIDRKTKIKIAEHIRDNNGWSKATDWNIVIL
jgi:hypothetical protein